MSDAVSVHQSVPAVIGADASSVGHDEAKGRTVSRILQVACCCGVLLSTLAVSAEPPQTGPETEKRFPPLKVPEGFKATLFACDPLIEYPSAIALGPRANTLFVAVDYMTGLGTTDIIRRDEIRLVEDTDGDGYADKAPVWADGFNSIQGMTYQRDDVGRRGDETGRVDWQCGSVAEVVHDFRCRPGGSCSGGRGGFAQKNPLAQIIGRLHK